MTSFPYKTQPLYPAQRAILQASCRARGHYLAMEQGTGKSWVTLNTAAYLALNGAIDGMIVCAPNGVHVQWALDQIPAHMPDIIRATSYVWRSGAERTAKGKRTREALKHGKSRARVLSEPFTAFVRGSAFPIFCVNTEAVGKVPALEKAFQLMLATRRCLLVLDEASDFSSPSAVRTRTILRYARLAPFRRCLDGTPTNGLPWDMWAAYRFLDPGILGYAPTYGAMKGAHGEWRAWERVTGARPVKLLRKARDGTPMLKALDRFREAVAPYTSRVTKADVLPHLPPKRFSAHYFELTPGQTRLMRTLRATLRATLDSGGTVTAEHVLTLALRLQQIANGFVPLDVAWSGAVTQPTEWLMTPEENPRVNALAAVLRARPPAHYPTIIWTRYQADLDLLRDVLTGPAWGLRVGVYDGRVSAEDRLRVKGAFMDGTLDIFLSNPAAGAKGLNLYRATSVIYYANYFGLRRRLQSEDRAHRIGTIAPVTYTDLIGLSGDLDPLSARAQRESIDWTIRRALRANKSVADLLTGDASLSDWI